MSKQLTDWKTQVKIEQDYICPVCGRQCNDYTMNIHHKRAKCKGGKSDRENVVGWCIECHQKYHKKYGVQTSDDYGKPIRNK